MTTDSFDVALAAAAQPLVRERISSTIAADLDTLGAVGTRHEHPGLTVAGTVVAGALVVAAGSLVAGSARPALTRDAVALTAAAGGPLISTIDGPVFVRRGANGHTLEVVLQSTAASELILATYVESVPGVNVSSSSIHQITCPASTRLEQEYYAFGQETYAKTITLHGISGIASTVVRGMYVIALEPSTMTGTEWRFTTESGGGGWSKASFKGVPSLSTLNPSGCYTSS